MTNLCTGASGVLGSAIYRAFKKTDCSLTGLANSRTQGGLVSLDLTNQVVTENFLRDLKPDCPPSILSFTDVSH